MAELDANRDRRIDRKELAASSAWRDAADRLDANKDGMVVDTELEARISLYRDARDIGIPVRLRFRHNGQPLAATVVRLTPDPAIAALIPMVESRTGPDGVATFNSVIGGGVLSGAYRIEGDWPAPGFVTKPSGLEVAADSGGTTVNQIVELRKGG